MPPISTGRGTVLRFIDIHPRTGRSQYISGRTHVFGHLNVPHWLADYYEVGPASAVPADNCEVGEARRYSYFHCG